MTTNAPAPSADEPTNAMVERVRELQKAFPDSVLNAIKATSLRAVCAVMAAGMPTNPSKEKVFATALRVSSWYPDDFTASFAALKDVTVQQRHDFGNFGVMPKRRRGPIK